MSRELVLSEGSGSWFCQTVQEVDSVRMTRELVSQEDQGVGSVRRSGELVLSGCRELVPPECPGS